MNQIVQFIFFRPMKAASNKLRRILLIPGSTRNGSTNVAALRAMLDAAERDVSAVLFEGLAELPAFNPDDDYEPLPGPVAALREQIASADGILFCTPEYAGALPGSFKNLLDWTVGGPEMDRKPVAWINVAAEGRGLNVSGRDGPRLSGRDAARARRPAGVRAAGSGRPRRPRPRELGEDGDRGRPAHLRGRTWSGCGGELATQRRGGVMQLRVARHTERLAEVVAFYRDGIGLPEVGTFRDHDGYDGVFLAEEGTGLSSIDGRRRPGCSGTAS